ncbi:FHIPEP family protein [Treponema bryantii]|uniref:FHIPEP family protein n=1 Tax=Treponema bryantii TaxID=163 RepID=A0A1I3LNQ1_9SPIR|nr:FHIPEP family type III secretion protein [Treponema bryantii]SFI86371.1 FHIPEP family protein [Treponema bryantii]
MYKFIVKHIVTIASIFPVALLFIPLPELALNIAYILLWGLCMFLMAIVRSSNEKLLPLPRMILFLSLAILGIEISYTRIILTYEMHIRMNPETCFKFMYIINIIVAVTLLGLSYHFVIKRGTKAAEVTARFALDTMNQRLFDIDNKLNTGEITEEEAEQQKEKVRQDIDFFCNLDGSSRFLAGNMKALIFIYVLSIVGGCLYGVLKNAYSIQDALNIVSLPALLSTICGSMCITILASCVSYSLMNAKESQ